MDEASQMMQSRHVVRLGRDGRPRQIKRGNPVLLRPSNIRDRVVANMHHIGRQAAERFDHLTKQAARIFVASQVGRGEDRKRLAVAAIRQKLADPRCW